MSYVIVNVKTEMLYHKPGHYTSSVYETGRGAKIAYSKMIKKSNKPSEWILMDYRTYHDTVNCLVTVKNLLTGMPVQIRKNDVGSCLDPSTERYHSM
jgi:hypothetical protein